ncbi:MAG TPA: helix-turn-helix transcriptional regulator [Mesorhizobium sp.]|jgi:DNA-binding CsgD family transcriptional regulator|uniref:helix-turn-helix transcriptional regulator n=1 Tax=Mesorhizobium sp. TaxID=1871066 RepID=UPI002DDD9BCD|nr:helix-turn-helix transcriptional regulator [Mesorhizobium sp.]HEV2503950.1 helix-turn-helix transcriptional regulator [Mesorhizobium sp.]
MTVALGQFSELVSNIHEAALDEVRWDFTLRRIAGAFDAFGVALLAVDPKSREMKVASSGTDPAAMQTYNAYYGRMDPVAAAIRHSPVGAILTGNQITSRSQLLRSEFFVDWALPNEVGDGLFAKLNTDAMVDAWLCIAAPLRSASYGTQERQDLMRLLMPHLRQALRTQSLLGQHTTIGRDIFDAWEAVRHGVIFVSAHGKVMHANSAALDHIRKGLDLKIGIGGCLQAVRPADDAALQRLIASSIQAPADGTPSGGSYALHSSNSPHPILLQVVPLGRSNGDGKLSSALILLVNPQAQAEFPSSVLRQTYRLTRAETDVALAVARCPGLQAVADELSVSLSTVRVHLQRVFEKTGTNRQADLIRLMMMLDGALHQTEHRS